MKNIDKAALYLGNDTNSSIVPKASLAIPDLGVDKRFADSGFKSFEIDGAYAQNSLALISYPAGRGRYVASYYNYASSGRSQKAGFTMFDETGVVDPSFGIDGSLTVQLDSSGYTVPRSMFIDAKGRLIAYAESVNLDGDFIQAVPYLMCMDEKGRLDNTFGDQGLLNLAKLLDSHFIPLNPEFERSHCSGAVFEPNGGCYLTCLLFSSDEWASLIVRLDANGVIDETFGARGGVIIRFDDELSQDKGLSQLVVHGARLVSVFVTPDESHWSLLRAFTLTGEPDLNYGVAGNVQLEGLIFRGCALHYDNSLRLLGFGYADSSEPRRAAASMWAVDEAGTITKRFELLIAPAAASEWEVATMAVDRIYCGGEIDESFPMLGCYRIGSGELDYSFAESGYGMPASTDASFAMPPELTSYGSLLVAGRWHGVATVFAVATS